jgi:glucose/mannose-6-phosphate isomerase
MLDDPAALRRVDASDMLGVLAGLPDQVRDATVAAQSYHPRLEGPFSSVLFAAMGGSAMGADMAALRLAQQGAVPAVVARGYEPPSWVGPGTLVVAVSYSGNTEETLASVKAAKARGAQILAITSGGELATWAPANGGDLLLVPKGLQPRAALGWLTFATVGALEALGLTRADKEAEAVAAHLERLRSQLEPQHREATNPSKQLARALHHRIALVHGAGALEVAARRFATQLNENPKVLCTWGPVPEIHHNELSAWFADTKRLKEEFQPILFQGEPAGTPLGARERANIALLREAGAQPIVVEARGDTMLAKVFHAIYVGDYASVYLACLLGRDPTPVDAIQRLKARMAEFRKA